MRSRRLTLSAALLALAAAGCGPRPGSAPGAPRGPAGPAGIPTAFAAADGWTIRGDFSPAPGAKGAVVLLHQRGGGAADWAPLVGRLSAAGLAVLAIDQRGAGRSQGRANGGDAPWDTTPDIAAAVRWLGSKGFSARQVGLAGASYGANNALIYAAAHPEVAAVALLSPGTDYHGLRIEPAARAYRGPVLVLSARDDAVTEGGPGVVERAAAGAKEVRTYDGRAHGTDLLPEHPEALDALTAFFQAHLK